MTHSCSIRVSCCKCHKETSLLNLNKHYNACDGSIKIVQHYPDDLKCQFCDKECKNNNSFRNHERCCSSNPNRKFSIGNTGKTGKKGNNQFTRAKLLGLPKPEISQETRAKLSKNIKSRSTEFHTENGIKISKTINEKVANGEWHTSLAKHMHYDYNGVDLHGSWELAYAKYLDEHNIKWIRCRNSFPYTFEGKIRKYTPDFYLTESDEYIEIKGYKTSKDDAKWHQFPNYLKLTVLMENELKALGII